METELMGGWWRMAEGFELYCHLISLWFLRNGTRKFYDVECDIFLSLHAYRSALSSGGLEAILCLMASYWWAQIEMECCFRSFELDIAWRETLLEELWRAQAAFIINLSFYWGRAINL